MRAEEVIKKSVKCIELCTENYGLDNYLDDYIIDPKERAKLSSLLFNYYRNKLTVEYITNKFAKSKIKNKVRMVLSVAVTQMFFQRSIPSEIIVNSAVDYSKRVFGKSTGGFVNAVLRNIERNKEKFQDFLNEAPENVKLNIPDFVLRRWEKYYKNEDLLRIISIIKQPRYYIYYRFIKPSFDDIPLFEAETLDIETYKSSFTFYRSQNSATVVNSKELKQGRIYIQDPATSMAVSAVNFKGKGKILDGCSAPGGKTLMLAELYPECDIVASDSLIKNFNKNDLNKIINTLFHAVYTRIKHTDLNKNENKLWPDAIWKNAQGMCDSEAWLLSELAYQQGFETMIIYLRNPKTGISPHTLCEIRKGKQVWICDPFFGSILSNISFGQLAVNAQLLDKFWPNKNLWHESMGKAEFWLPAYVQDYTQRNQLLAKAIYTQLNDKAPRFGEDPFKRFFKYIELMNSGSPNIDKKFSYGLWFFPFRLLGAEFNNQ